MNFGKFLTAVFMLEMLFAFFGEPTWSSECNSACDGLPSTQAEFLTQDSKTASFRVGDWCGARSCLEDVGVTPFLYYDSIFAANVDGGIESDEDFTGQIYAGADFDLGKLWGWEGTTMKVSMVERHGGSISQSVGGIYDPMCIFGGQVGYLYQLWLEKSFCEDWAFKIGRVSADTDFANNGLYRYSLSTAINGPVRAMLLENIITSFPYPVWGGRLKYTPSDRNQFQIGVYQIGEGMWDFTRHGLDFSIRDDDGVSLVAQYDWTPKVHGRSSRLSLGLVSSFFEFDDFDGIGTTNQFLRLYGHADVEVTEGLTLFGFATHSDQEQVAKTPVQISGGINEKGLIPGRENDRSVFFLTYGQLSDKYGDSIGSEVDYEWVYELGHRIQISPSVYIQPAMQYIVHPGGTGDIPDSTVLGAWMGAAF